jgi:hypothetical protein
VSLERFNVKKQKPIRTKHYNAIAKVVAMKVSLIEVKKIQKLKQQLCFVLFVFN